MYDAELHVRVTKELRERLQELAAEDKRKLADYIRATLEGHVDNLYE
jgi:predicted DNA-binding protein